MNQLMKNRRVLLFSEVAPYRYYLLYRGQLLVLAGYIVVTLETLLAIKLGLTPITYWETLIISSTVILVTVLLFVFIVMHKKLLVWQEWMVFLVDMAFYLVFFSVWIYLLGEMRILGLFSCLVAITIVISYTTFLQSLLMSMTTVLVYYVTTWHAITSGLKGGSLVRESFLVFSLFPSFILVAATAKIIDNQRKRNEDSKVELRKANIELNELNRKLLHEQSLSDIEMELAHDIQSALFPGKPPVICDWDIAFVSKPRYGVSGDFYDFYTAGDRLEGLSLFDVSGHGVASALITILSKPVLFRNFKKFSSGRTGSILDFTNRDLFEQLEEVNTYLTGILLRMRDDYVEYVNAGHPDLLHLQGGSGNVRVVTDPEGRFKGNPIGISSGTSRYTALKFKVAQGDTLLLFSDGASEIRNSEGVLFGRERIVSVLAETAGMNADDTLAHLMKRCKEFTGDEPPADDITVIVAKKF